MWVWQVAMRYLKDSTRNVFCSKECLKLLYFLSSTPMFFLVTTDAIIICNSKPQGLCENSGTWAKIPGLSRPFRDTWQLCILNS